MSKRFKNFIKNFRKIDLIIGGLYSPIDIKETISTTISYFQDDITWCVPVAKHKMNWESLYFLHDLNTWITSFSLDYLLGAVFFYMLRFDNIFKCYAWNVLLSLIIGTGGSVNYQPKNTLTRIYYILIAIYGLEYNILLNSFMISILTKPLQIWQIDNINDAIINNFEFLIPSGYYMENDFTKSIIIFAELI